MSDLFGNAPTASNPTPKSKGVYVGAVAIWRDGMLLHKCSICGADRAPFGFGVSLRGTMMTGRWFCGAHKDQG